MFGFLKGWSRLYSPVDQAVLFNYVIEDEIRISEVIKLFYVRKKNSGTRGLVLKFGYTGNTQYHKLFDDDINRLSDEFQKYILYAKNKADDA